MVNPQITALAKVQDGWTGVIRVTVGLVVAEVTPPPRGSALSVMRMLLIEVIRVHGGAWAIWSTSAGVFEMVSGSLFSVATSGTTTGRLGLTGSLSGSNAYTFPSTFSEGLVPSLGVQVKTSMTSRASGGVVSDGSAGWTAGPDGTRATMRLYASFSGVVSGEATLDGGGTWDVMTFRNEDPPPLARLMIRSVRRTRWGMLGSNHRLNCTAVEVSS